MNEITLYLTALLKELENMNGVMAVTVTDSLGSAPRGDGARMLVAVSYTHLVYKFQIIFHNFFGHSRVTAQKTVEADSQHSPDFLLTALRPHANHMAPQKISVITVIRCV